MFLDQLNSVSEPGYIQLLDMAENKKMSGASSHSHKNVNKTSEPIDKWMTTLHQVRTLKSCTEDLDRKMLELQRLLGRMQAPLSVESPNFYGVSHKPTFTAL